MKKYSEDYYASAFGPFKDFAAKAHGEIERTVSFAYMKEEISASEALPLFKEGTAFLTVLLKKFPSTEGAAPVFVESMEILRFMAENVLNLVEVLVLKIEGRSEEEIAEADQKEKSVFQRTGTSFSAVCGRLLRKHDNGWHSGLRKDGHLRLRSGR